MQAFAFNIDIVNDLLQTQFDVQRELLRTNPAKRVQQREQVNLLKSMVEVCPESNLIDEFIGDW